jgi:Repeating coiled region of VPS13
MYKTDFEKLDSSATAVFAFDFEKNPASREADFAITMRLEPMEVIYNEHTLSELVGFFQTIATKEISQEKVEDFIVIAKEMSTHFMRQRKRVYLNLVLKGPTIVIPEHGSIQR